jgi:hypothetical protein
MIGDVVKVFGVCFRCRRDITSPPWHVRLDSGRVLMCAACEPSWRGLPGDWKPRRAKAASKAMEAAMSLFNLPSQSSDSPGAAGESVVAQ